MLQMRAVTSKCTKLIDAHQNFLDALEGCSASERGRRERSTTITLHRVNSCDSCQEIMLDFDLCGESALSDQRYEHLMATSWEYVREGLLVEDWGCNKAVFSVKHHGIFRNAATGDIFVYSEDDFDSWNMKEGKQDAINYFSRSVFPMVNSSSKAKCNAMVPGFQFVPALDAPSRNEGKRCTFVVVTALLGDRDKLASYDAEMHRLQSFERKIAMSSCWFAFVDAAAAEEHLRGKWRSTPKDAPQRMAKGNAMHRFGIWNMIILQKEILPFGDAEKGKNSRIPKMLGHLAFQNAHYMLYVDAKLRVKAIENPWLLLYNELVLPKVSWVSPKHPERSNVFEEARCVHLLGLATDNVLDQMRLYQKVGLPYSAGLVEGEWHLRDLRDARSGQLGCEWFKEFVKWGHNRDQTSFPFALWNIQRQHTTPFFRSVEYVRGINSFYHAERKKAPKGKGRLHSSLCSIDPVNATTKYYIENYFQDNSLVAMHSGD